GWGLQASTQEADFRAGRKTRNDRYSLSLTARPDTDLLLTVRGGQESTDVLGVARRSYDNYGAELTWTPSPRTTVNLSTDERYFGNSRQILVEHRFLRSLIRFTSIRGASGDGIGTGSGGASGVGVGQPISLYQLFFEQFASVQPDPVLREQLVLNFLRAQGLDPFAVVGGGFINNGITLQRREDLSYSLTGVRNTFSLQAFRSASQVLDRVGQSQSPNPAFGNGSVTQHGFTATLSHRLTPTASASISASQSRTASSGSQSGNDLRSVNLTLSEQLSRRVSGNLSARYSDFDSPTQPYREAALQASINVRF
ncbi:MAG: TIGR03016 family PEP-CTERM system-associated outer membrane protein, partial [Rubrivivax sp.]